MGLRRISFCSALNPDRALPKRATTPAHKRELEPVFKPTCLGVRKFSPPFGLRGICRPHHNRCKFQQRTTIDRLSSGARCKSAAPLKSDNHCFVVSLRHALPRHIPASPVRKARSMVYTGLSLRPSFVWCLFAKSAEYLGSPIRADESMPDIYEIEK